MISKCAVLPLYDVRSIPIGQRKSFSLLHLLLKGDFP